MATIIVAAGASQRMAGINKLFAPLRDKPLLAWSVETCQECSLISQIVLVLNDKDLEQGREVKESRHWSKASICPGGPRRQDSVREGLKRIADCQLVMIHDGGRPFLTPDLIQNGFRLASRTGSAVAAVPVKDTIKLVADDRLIGKTLERHNLWAAQTPQIFSRGTITTAYERLTAEVTDDGAAVESLGAEVHLYMGDYRNIKVTTPEDLALARIIAEGGL
ncbi:MAG: 2-C-methyl-D-erythritol 4-phosphate cytidylyltransferase [Dehalococcoidia bacterium]